MNAGNLLSPAAKLRMRVHDRIRFWSVTLAAYLVILAAGSAIAWNSSRVREVLSASVVDAAQSQAESLERQVDTLYSQVRRQRQLLASELAVGKHPDWSILLSVIARIKGADIELTSLELRPAGEGTQVSRTARPSRYSLQLVGTAADHAELAAFVLRMEQQGLFEHVVLVQNSATHEQATRVTFVVQAELDDSPAPEQQRRPQETSR